MPLPAVVQRPGDRFQLRPRHRARPQQGHPAVQNRYDRALQPDRAGAAVHPSGHSESGFLQGVPKGRRTGSPRAIGRRRHDRPAERRQHRSRAFVPRHAQGHAVQARAGQVAHPSGVTDWRHQGQRSRPESLGQPPRLFIEHTHRFSGVRVRDVGDQRIEARPPLGLEDRGHGLRVRSVGPQPIDRLGRQQDKRALPQGLGGLFGRGAHGRRGISGIIRCSTLSRSTN